MLLCKCVPILTPDSQEIGCVLLCKCVPILTPDSQEIGCVLLCKCVPILTPDSQEIGCVLLCKCVPILTPDSQEIGCVFLCKCVRILTLDVLRIAEYPKYARRLTNLAKSGYFSVVLYVIQKSTDSASYFSASSSRAATGYIRNILHLCKLLGPGLLWINW